VGGGLVRGWRVGGSVDLDQHEARRVLGRLHDVEARDAWLLQALAFSIVAAMKASTARL
jgi:hypothetical protein